MLCASPGHPRPGVSGSSFSTGFVRHAGSRPAASVSTGGGVPRLPPAAPAPAGHVSSQQDLPRHAQPGEQCALQLPPHSRLQSSPAQPCAAHHSRGPPVGFPASPASPHTSTPASQRQSGQLQSPVGAIAIRKEQEHLSVGAALAPWEVAPSENLAPLARMGWPWPRGSHGCHFSTCQAWRNDTGYRVQPWRLKILWDSQWPFDMIGAPMASCLPIVWGKPAERGSLGRMSSSTLHVHATDTGVLVSKVQLASPETDGLASLWWLSDGSGFCARSWGIYSMTVVCTVSVAGQVLSSVSREGPFQISEPLDFMYTAMRPADPSPRLVGPVQIIHRLTGKSIAIPKDLFHHLNQCSLLLKMTGSHNGTFASLLSHDGQQRWFMRFDKDHLVYSQLHAVPVPLASSIDEMEAKLFFSPHGRALAIKLLYAWQHDIQPKLLTWHLSEQVEATCWHVLDFPLPLPSAASSNSPEVGRHPSSCVCVCAVAFAGQLGLFCAATNSCLCCWAIGHLFQHPAMYQLDGLSWASHGCQLSLRSRRDGELRLECDSQ